MYLNVQFILRTVKAALVMLNVLCLSKNLNKWQLLGEYKHFRKRKRLF